MSIQSAPYYWARCDRCGEDAEYGDFSAMRGPDQAVECLGDDWLVEVAGTEEMHYCADCTEWDDDGDKLVVKGPESNDSDAAS